MSSSISVCWGYFSLLWFGSLGISVHQDQWWCVLRGSWGILLIKAMIGSKCFRQSPRKSERFFFLCLPLGRTAFSLFHLLVLVPSFSLQFVMDVDSLLQSMKAKALGSWGNGHCLLQHPLLGWCLQLSLGQGHSSEDRTKQQLLRDGYQERKSVAWLQLGDLGDEIWHSSIPSQWFIKLADLFKLCTTAFSQGAKYRINKGLSGNSIHGKTALAVSSWQK